MLGQGHLREMGSGASGTNVAPSNGNAKHSTGSSASSKSMLSTKSETSSAVDAPKLDVYTPVDNKAFLSKPFPGEHESSTIAYIPKRINGVEVVVESTSKHLTCGTWQATNKHLNRADAPGVAYRSSKNVDDKMGALVLPWGTSVIGVDEGDGWIRLEDRKAPGLPACAALDLTFLDPLGAEKVARFLKRPLGCRIVMHELPVRVDAVYDLGLAEQLGVQQGWILVKVNGADVSGRAFDEQFSVLMKGMQVLPTEPRRQSLEIVFEAGEAGRRETVVFYKKPLGLTFENRKPIVVKSIREDCVASRHGVETGWVLAQVDGRTVDDISFEEQLDLLTSGVSGLPESTYSVAPPLFTSPNFASAKQSDGVLSAAADNGTPAGDSWDGRL